MHNYIERRELKYQHLNDIVGMLEFSKLHIKRIFKNYTDNIFLEEAIGMCKK